MKKFTTVFAILAAVLTLSACNTVKGMGQDVQKAGSVIEDAARKH